MPQSPPPIAPVSRPSRPAAVVPPPRTERDDAAAHLRLSIARDGLGLELAEPARVGCLEIVELALSLPKLRFPVDVSGGVARFRHRRGILERLVVEVDALDLGRWAAPRLRGVLGPRAPEVWVSVRKAGATVCIADLDAERVPGPDETPGAPRLLAFEIDLDANDDQLGITLTQARGAGLPGPATTLAIAAVQALLGKSASPRGARFVVENAARALTRIILPNAGVRAPSTERVHWTGFGAHADRWILYAQKDGAPAEATEQATRAEECAALAREGDEARVQGDLERARILDVAALERAPRHPELCRRIAEIDQLAGGRAEAALATLVESERQPGAHEGLLAAELLVEVGDTEAAVASLVRIGESEPAPALGARAFERAAELTLDPLDALVWLDLAVARAPRMAHVRWTRLERRLSAGRLEDAVADAEYLEALASGARARHAVWRRAGRVWQRAGLRAEAASVFERALRFDPDDAQAVAGLGVALVESERAARGTALLAHAVELAEAHGEAAHRIVIDLARALAGALEDRPAAVARVRTVPADAPEAPLARTLEGRWRAELGDFAGASLAYARLRDLASARVTPGTEADVARLVEWLVEAAAFEADRRDDPQAAQRHLACALRLSPRDAAVQRAYRDIARRAGRPEEDAEAEEAPAASGPEAVPAPAPAITAFRTEPPSGERPAFDLDLPSDAPEDAAGAAAEAADAARVEELTRALQADPHNDAVVDELAERLARLGRTHELLALLSARLEDATPERRVELIPKQRAVLERLAENAQAAGHPLEAELFRDALAMLDD